MSLVKILGLCRAGELGLGGAETGAMNEKCRVLGSVRMTWGLKYLGADC